MPRPPHPEDVGTPVHEEIALPDSSEEQLACFVVQLAYVVANLCVTKRWDKSGAAQELLIMCDLLKTRYPGQFPPAPQQES